MKMTELEPTLPNGFHDAEIFAIAIDYVKHEAVLSMALWVDYEKQRPGQSGHTPLMRRAELVFRGLEHAIIRPPQNQTIAENDELSVIGFDGVPDYIESPPAVPDGAFAYSFYVSEWNGAMVFVAHDADFRWLEPQRQP